MEKKVEIKESQEAMITFTIRGDEWKKAQEKEFRKLAANLKVKGFRQGHVPLDMAKKMISQSEIIQEAVLSCVNKEYGNVLNENQLRPITDPKLNITNVKEDEVEAVVRFALAPKVELGEYKGLKIEKKEVTVSDEEKEEFILSLRKDQATMNVKEGEAKIGDTVIIDFKGYIDDSPFDGGEAKGYELELGSHSFVPGFEEQLVGLKAGEERVIEVTFPENYVKNLKGKKANFNVRCHDVKEKVLPELDENFFKELNNKEVQNKEELDAYSLKMVKERKERAAKKEYQEALLQKILDGSKVFVAESLLQEEAMANIENIRKQVEKNGLSFEDYLSINGLTNEKFIEDKKEEALKNFKSMLVIEEICRKENIVVTKEILDAKYQEIATQYNMKVEDVQKALEPNLEQFVRNLRSTMFTEFLEKNNQ